MADSLLTVNAPAVISEVIDGEAVIMDMSNGRYFSCRDLGGEIWSMIEKGSSRPQIARSVLGRYAVEPEVFSEALEDFLKALSDNGLIREGAEAPTVDSWPEPGTEPSPARLPFHPPVLSAHSDLEDLLLLDPIHDVDDAGWPTPKPPGKGAT